MEPTTDEERPTAFVLGAGAAHGAVQVGQLHALRDAGLCPDMLVASSVGALNAAVVALDPDGGADRLERVWRRMRARDLVRLGGPSAWGQRALLDGAGLREVVEACIPPRLTFDDLAVPLAVVTAEAGTGRALVLHSGRVVPALLAACAIPGLLPPVTVDGTRLRDGGGRFDLPIAEAFRFGAAAVVALPTTRWPRWVGYDGYRASAPIDDPRILVLGGARPPGTGWSLARTGFLVRQGEVAATRRLRGHRLWAPLLARPSWDACPA